MTINEASAGIKVRGNSSAYYGDVSQILANKVPYRIKFDKKTNMLGLNNGAECKSWVLLKSDWELSWVTAISAQTVSLFTSM